MESESDTLDSHGTFLPTTRAGADLFPSQWFSYISKEIDFKRQDKNAAVPLPFHDAVHFTGEEWYKLSFPSIFFNPQGELYLRESETSNWNQGSLRSLNSHCYDTCYEKYVIESAIDGLEIPIETML